MFHDLSAAQQICIDLETYDPNLKEKGCGAFRDGYILGIAIGTDTGVREYYPLQHPNSNNFDRDKVLSYLKKELSRENQYKLGANILYDLEYLAAYGVEAKGKWVDVQIAEPLIDENRQSYSLDSLAQKYLGEKKKSHWLEEKAKEQKLKGDFRAHLYKFTADQVKDYAIGDIDLPLRIFEKQRAILKEEELMDVFSIETRLLPLLLKMKIKGCTLDLRKAIELKDNLLTRQKELSKLIEDAGLSASTSHAGRNKLKEFFDKHDLFVPYTKKTNKPSFTGPYLQGIDKEELKWVLEHKHLEKFIGTFLKSQLIGNCDNDNRIHAQFNSLRDSTGGTVTGRFSSSKPNLQNIPSNDTALGAQCRSLFLPEEGHLFGSVDWSQIEYRILCHFARGAGATEVRQAFNDDPHLDIHKWCAYAAELCTDSSSDAEKSKARKQAKAINFGIIYGQGAAKTARVLDLSVEEAKAFLKHFNRKMPFARNTANEAMNLAENRGWVKTILGRRRRFPLFEPATYQEGIERELPLPEEEALAKWGKNIKRGHTYKALNAIIQGSSADLLKLSMVKAYEGGLFDVLVPLTTVHDELNVSVPQTTIGLEAYKDLVNIMQTCYPFQVPIIVEAGLGKNWSEAKK